MKAILLGICILFAANGFSQSVIIRGKVIDKNTRQPVIAASIVLPNGTGTSSDTNGDFKLTINHFPVTLTIGHVSYGKMEVLLPADPQKQIIIELEELVSEIGEVQITAEKLRILTEKDDFTLQDFAFDKENLWLLGYLKNQATQGRLWLANLYGDTITSIPVKNPERLYRDIFGTVHLVGRDSVYQVYKNGEEVVFADTSNRTEFFQIMTPIAVFGNKLVYQQYFMGKQGLHTYYYSGNDQKPYFLCETRDYAEERRQTDEFVFGQRMELLEQSMSTDSMVRLNANIAIGRSKMARHMIFNIKVKVPVFSFMDTLFIANIYKDSLNVYNPEGKYVRSIPISYHRDSVLQDVKYQDLSYLIDPINQKAYILQKKTGALILKYFEPTLGHAGLTVPLPDYPGMSGITVYGNAVYFLYPEKKYPYYVRLYRYQL